MKLLNCVKVNKTKMKLITVAVSHASYRAKLYILQESVLGILPDCAFQSDIIDSKSIFQVPVSTKNMACRQLPQLLKKSGCQVIIANRGKNSEVDNLIKFINTTTRIYKIIQLFDS